MFFRCSSYMYFRCVFNALRCAFNAYLILNECSGCSIKAGWMRKQQDSSANSSNAHSMLIQCTYNAHPKQIWGSSNAHSVLFQCSSDDLPMLFQRSFEYLWMLTQCVLDAYLILKLYSVKPHLMLLGCSCMIIQCSLNALWFLKQWTLNGNRSNALSMLLLLRGRCCSPMPKILHGHKIVSPSLTSPPH